MNTRDPVCGMEDESERLVTAQRLDDLIPGQTGQLTPHLNSARYAMAPRVQQHEA